jgi:hypothetical protein
MSQAYFHVTHMSTPNCFMHARRMPTFQPMCQAVHAKPAMIALEGESGQNEPMNWRERISVNPAVLPRPSVCPPADDVAAGVPREEILRNYAALKDLDMDAALAYAAELTREGTADLPLEIKA